jgi:hypothetical protein
MNTPFDFKSMDSERLVYIRPVNVSDLPDEVQSQAGEADLVYALHNADGERLALVKDRSMAFILARQNDFSPVNVH